MSESSKLDNIIGIFCSRFQCDWAFFLSTVLVVHLITLFRMNSPSHTLLFWDRSNYNDIARQQDSVGNNCCGENTDNSSNITAWMAGNL
mmetsp:Transcript_2465/g.6588  ORF Transcript_2465/g.6588 Transcript_2465/m.6588 type:complete len:89 (-) Transcript_2465:21-287(-)